MRQRRVCGITIQRGGGGGAIKVIMGKTGGIQNKKASLGGKGYVFLAGNILHSVRKGSFVQKEASDTTHILTQWPKIASSLNILLETSVGLFEEGSFMERVLRKHLIFSLEIMALRHKFTANSASHLGRRGRERERERGGAMRRRNNKKQRLLLLFPPPAISHWASIYLR